ncbi:pyridoxamine 5'-phosphate oxidase [Niabella yanshanensis]|uniref:Pyridoxine/pyridoxamine 5'-phosphate oxidase n=1 Tax=Niabella yanshanensis TaxID=577386 RepID=A0ABZ0WB78_9BACT|nr:pyridoxamine 5'-phosphate oxidase [Niabella yanshanensis]WQD40563.1 pyridoxamine 5'-phosphate oxidase [Niabella yanshanensis]
MSIADIRTQYSLKSLLEADAFPDAMDQFQHWWNEATHAELTEVNAMTLATASADGLPDARIVLLKDFSSKGFTFFTNYESRKGQELAQNPRACLVFFWKELERQVRITGNVAKISKADSETYFFSRPVGSQLGAWASRQSQVLPNREFLAEKLSTLESEVNAGKSFGKPDYWGGYIVQPSSIEFWQGRPSRLHDRLLYTLQADGGWKIERLSP